MEVDGKSLLDIFVWFQRAKSLPEILCFVRFLLLFFKW